MCAKEFLKSKMSQKILKRFLSGVQLSQYIKLTEPKSAGVIQLNRPKALNAINFEMFEYVRPQKWHSISLFTSFLFLSSSIHQLLQRFEQEKDVVIFKGLGKVFCAGGDVKATSGAAREQIVSGYTTGYRSVNLITNYKKPYIALMDGLAMGGAAYYSIPAKYTVATERTIFAMPETSLGIASRKLRSFL